MNDRRIGARLLSALEILLVGLTAVMFTWGVVLAQNPPNMLCTAPTQSGCTTQDCPGDGGQCNGQNYAFSERSAFSYRLCNGAAGACQGWSANLKTCENRFYMMRDCSDTPCKLTTTISACSP